MASADRFKLVTTSEVNEIINNAVPENTKKATKFAVKIFNGQCQSVSDFNRPRANTIFRGLFYNIVRVIPKFNSSLRKPAPDLDQFGNAKQS